MCWPSFLDSTSVASAGIGSSLTFSAGTAGADEDGVSAAFAFLAAGRSATAVGRESLDGAALAVDGNIGEPVSGAVKVSSTSHVSPNTLSGPPVLSCPCTEPLSILKSLDLIVPSALNVPLSAV